MPRMCSVQGCNNKQKKWSPQCFHSFPTKDPERMKLWLIALNVDPNTPEEKVKKMLVCSEHFVRDDYQDKLQLRTMTKRFFLKDTAIPSVGVTHRVFPALYEQQARGGTTLTFGAVEPELRPGSCSVVGCCSWRRSVQRFKLPKDAERRFEWVQFLANVNKQRFKESFWRNISICRDHFEDACFESLVTFMSTSESGVTGRVQLTLKPGAVPSLPPRPEPSKPKPDVNRPKCGKPAKKKAACQSHTPKTEDGPTSCTEEPRLTSTAAEGSLVTSRNTSDPSVSDQMHPKSAPIDVIREKATLQQMQDGDVVNEKRLLQLFNCRCPLCGGCGSNVSVEKVTVGTLLILNKQCLQCGYSKQWKSQITATVPAAIEQHLTPGTDVTLGTDVIASTSQAEPIDDTHSSTTEVPEIIAVSGEGGDSMRETDGSGDQDDVDSDENLRPASPFLMDVELQKKTDDQTKNEEEKSDDDPPPAPKHSELCTDCGMFFSTQNPHTCEHKSKPFCCIICGKRYVSEFTLNDHRKIHDENYEHQRKY